MAKKNINTKSKKKVKRVNKVSKTNTDKTKLYRVNDLKKKVKNMTPFKIGCLLAYILLLILSYINLGLLFSLFIAIGILIILGVAQLLDKVKNKKKQKRIVHIILIALLSIGILMVILLSVFLVYITIKAPKFDAKLLNKPEISILYDKDGNEIVKLGSERREKVTYDELPQVLIDAIVATEDSRYFQHNGFDAPRFIKASLGQVAGQAGAGGASTLTMQVVKNTLTGDESSGIKGIIRKFSDIYLSIFKLEKKYSKEEIIEFYVNNHFLGGNIYGVEEASLTYFGKHVSNLNLAEASILAGMFKSPNYYRPNVNPKNATARRATVLYLMKKHGYITAEEEKIANAIPVSNLTATAADTTATTHQYQGYIDTVVEELEKKYNVNPYVTPLLVYTNMDRNKQDGVNRVMNGESYNWVNDVVQSGVSVLDSETGKIVAIGAGRHKTGVNSFNYATQMNRQPGSTAKPLFDYGPLMEYNNASTYGYYNNEGYYPFVDEPYSYSNGKSVNNWDGRFMGTLTLRRSLALSRNIPALKSFKQVDNKKIIEFVTKLGIKPEVENGRIHEAHSLGAFNGVNPLQMSAAYAAFSNGGYYNEPYSVAKFEYRETKKVVEHTAKKEKAMSDSTAFMISNVLQDVVIGNGPIPNVATKTGTTNFDDQTIRARKLPGDAINDSWVVGFTPKTVIAMWYGYKEIDPEYVSRVIPAALQRDRLFRSLANEVFEKDKSAFKQPNSVVKLPIALGTSPAKIANEGAGSVIYEYFKKGMEPKETAAPEITTIPKPGNFKAVHNESSNTVSLSWDAVSINEKIEGHEFGYNIYLGSVFLGFTDKNSYTHSCSGDKCFGEYKVEPLFKGYSSIKGQTASYTLSPKLNLSLTYTGSTTIPSGSNLGIVLTSFKIKNGATDITSEAKVTECNPSQITIAGTSTINCIVNYKNANYQVTTSITAQ